MQLVMQQQLLLLLVQQPNGPLPVVQVQHLHVAQAREAHTRQEVQAVCHLVQVQGSGLTSKAACSCECSRHRVGKWPDRS